MNSFFTSIQVLFNKHLTIKIPLWLSVLVPFIFYFCWEHYWFKEINYRFIKWHTHLVPYLFVWVIVSIAAIKLSGWLGKQQTARVYLVLSSVVFVLFFVEIALIVSGITKTYLERISAYYFSVSEPLNATYYNNWLTTQKEHYLTKPEYSYWRPTNSLGFGDVEWKKEKPDSTTRIFTLGDSFTEGDGAHYDSTYPKFLLKRVKAEGKNVEVLNSGTCGSDPFYGYMNLKDRLLDYHPDEVILMIGSDDIFLDYRKRGGFERFRNDGKVIYRKAPWWEPIYACNHVFRLTTVLFGYDETLTTRRYSEEETKRTNIEIIRLFQEYSKLLESTGIKLKIVLHPVKGELHDKKYHYDFTEIQNGIKGLPSVSFSDLMPCFLQKMNQSNTTEQDYFWKIDGHHNAKGYELLADCVYSALENQ